MSECEPVWHLWAEPACWLSDELPLLPASWRYHVWKSAITLPVEGKEKAKGRRRSVEAGELLVPLARLTEAHWMKWFKNVTYSKSGPGIGDLVVHEIESVFSANPERFDIPIIPRLPYRNSGSNDLPFLTSTWDLLKKRHLDDEDSLNRLLGGTYFDIFEALGSVKAVLDISITAQSWIDPKYTREVVFLHPKPPESAPDFLRMMRVRVFRNAGLVAKGKHYTTDFADAVSRRWGVTIEKPWTLEQVGDLLGVTRERVRQITGGMAHSYESRRWPIPSELRVIAEELVATNQEMLGVTWGGEVVNVRREDATRLLVISGLDGQSLAPLYGIEDRLGSYSLDLKTVRHRTYWASKRMGLVQQDLAVDNIVDEFTGVPVELIREAISYVASHDALPYDYVLIENQGSCFLINALVSVLSKNGALPPAELHEALVRFFKYRTPGLIFPPQRVIDALLSEDSRFVVEGGEVRLAEPIVKDIGETYEWMWQEIAMAPGHVLHRTELLQRGRENGYNASTLNVYFSYSTYFKPVKGNCVTLTGVVPSESDVAFARARGSEISVQTKVQSWEAKGAVVEVRVLVGNYLLDTGLLQLPVACRRIIGGKSFSIFWGKESRGNVGWSSSVTTGWSSVLSYGAILPGDEVTLVFDLAASQVFVTVSEDLVEDIEF
jgi:hypothetical protein